MSSDRVPKRPDSVRGYQPHTDSADFGYQPQGDGSVDLANVKPPRGGSAIVPPPPPAQPPQDDGKKE